MIKAVAFIVAILSISSLQLFATEIAEKEVLNSLLKDFLTGQTYTHHDRFWADDLIYTSSTGARFDKKFIMDGMRPNEASDKEETNQEGSIMTYSAEEIDIRVYDKTAIVAFKLVGTEKKADTVNHHYYFNTGTFLLRDNQWQAVAWQATKIPAE